MADYSFYVNCRNEGVLTIDFIQKEGIKTYQGQFIFVKTQNEASARRQITKVGEKYCLTGVELVKFTSSFIREVFDNDYRMVKLIGLQ